MRRRPAKLSLKECYDILRLEKGADIDTLKRAYRRRAFELHPDLNPNNPDASHLFQLLNEAYVALSVVLKPAAKSDAADEQKAKPEPEKDNTSSANQKKQQEDTKTNDKNHKADEPEQETQEATTADAGAQQDTSGARHSNAYAEQDVLRDLLNDPFARRVFEDIYSEINRQEVHKQNDIHNNQQETKNAAPPSGTSGTLHPSSTLKQPVRQPPKQSTRLHQGNLAWGTPKWSQNVKNGVAGAVKSWLRRQIDEEQKLTLSAARLAPGRRIRLQIRQGLSDEVQTIEIMLPQDFTVGKPIRLKGLGKKVGPWQGDLYLTINHE